MAHRLLELVTRVIPLRRKRASVVCVRDGQLLCVRLRDPVAQIARLFVPGGAVERGETPAQAAQRETLEETGYRIRVIPDALRVARYPFRWAGVDIDCTTHFFGGALVDASDAPQPRSPNEPAYNEACVWIPLSEVDQALGYHPQILAAVRQVLDQVGAPSTVVPQDAR
ncbi:MAG: NUDIX hydrolase [Myxococcales bacterium]|nr:NUDIX hydrolase [Myxococcales bacterium]MDD9966460.1 NUDIX hydrolase [Myxococcales bacterium]